VPVPAELDPDVNAPGDDAEKEVSGDDWGIKSRMSVLFVRKRDHHAFLRTFETLKRKLFAVVPAQNRNWHSPQ
jgi:hypothetical protein